MPPLHLKQLPPRPKILIHRLFKVEMVAAI
jgi:hypothetical protein